MPYPPVPRRLLAPAAACAAAAVLLAACAVPPGGGGAPSHPRAGTGHGQAAAGSHQHHAHAPSSQPAAPAPAVTTNRPAGVATTNRPAGAATIKVEMIDAFRFRPSRITVRQGRTVTFQITNVDQLAHEFVIGDREEQEHHEEMMQRLGDTHMHDHANAISVLPGETKRLTWTFPDRGTVLIGCHVLGHWAAGMKGSILVL
jgi:uncharacterized cupredoxin-like copper-binding protein